MCNEPFETYPSQNHSFCSPKCAQAFPWKSIMPMKAELMEMYQEKLLSLDLIGEKYGISFTPVKKWFQFYGIPIMRGRGRSKNIYRNYIPSPLILGKISGFQCGYVVGLIDGEGCIGLNKQKRGNYWMWRPYLHITNTRKELLEKCQELIGGNLSKGHAYGPNEKPCYNLRLFNYQLLAETLAIVTNLLIIKKKQAEIVLEFCRDRLAGSIDNQKGPTNKEMKAYEELKLLNRRGLAA